jgi:hypothetical protein
MESMQGITILEKNGNGIREKVHALYRQPIPPTWSPSYLEN